MRWLFLAVFAVLAACGAPQGPAPSDAPDCAKPDKEPIDGGLGGTGNQEQVLCQEE